MRGIKLLIFTLVLTLFTVFICAEAATVRFYDDSLNLVDTRNYEEGINSYEHRGHIIRGR
jgi:hypothetical protein